MFITVIKGGSRLTDEERGNIKDIFAHSKCPNESLRSLDGFQSFEDHVLHIDNGSGDKYAYPEDLEVVG